MFKPNYYILFNILNVSLTMGNITLFFNHVTHPRSPYLPTGIFFFTVLNDKVRKLELNYKKLTY